MVGTSLYVIKNTLNVILGLKIPPTLLQNFLKLLETNLRQFLLLYLHVLLVFLAELHRSQIVKVKTQDKTTHRVQVNCFNLLIQRQKQNRIRCTKKSCNVIKQDKELMMSIQSSSFRFYLIMFFHGRRNGQRGMVSVNVYITIRRKSQKFSEISRLLQTLSLTMKITCTADTILLRFLCFSCLSVRCIYIV